MTDEQPKVRHKRKLEKLREDANGRPGITAGRRYSSSGEQEDGSSNGTGERFSSVAQNLTGGISDGTQGITPESGIVGGRDSGTGQTITENGDYDSSLDQIGSNEIGQSASQHIERDMEAEKQRKRDLAAARQRRKRALEKEATQAQNPSRDSDTRDIKVDLKTPFKSQPLSEVKTFTEKEAEEQLEKLIFVYMRGSELLDDVLEIIVRDHEKVQIWSLDEQEAKLLATMQMERAKKDKVAARTVRTLIRIYDRMYIFMLIGPRMIATTQHVKAHGGLSFK